MNLQRIGVRKAPPTLTIEFLHDQKLYHHEIAMLSYLSTLSDALSILNALKRDHIAYIQTIPSSQMVRLIEKLMPIVSLPTADYNKVSETQLAAVKSKMDNVFLKNIVKPGDDNYVYDKQVSMIKLWMLYYA
ncbi:hypothetical protein THRCLA_20815 [Thraustotheca clavata]|uniref:Centrosomal protein of 19 kDa n=1 Tax=Thraustotheca clavata TaxID=74557 RepID=A0A1W0A372_9STRA|nr:hypothetical protein THRCLA_20815 [Thraustotheca clavata]